MGRRPKRGKERENFPKEGEGKGRNDPLDYAKSTKRKELLILMLCLLIGFFLRFYTFDQNSLWMDDNGVDLKSFLNAHTQTTLFYHTV